MKKSIIQNKMHLANAHTMFLRKTVVNRLRWITTFVIMIFLLLYSRGLFSQTFSNPIQLTYIDSLELYLADTFIVDTSNMWFSFQSLSRHLILVTSPIDTVITVKPDSVYIYTNINSNLQLVKSYDTVSIIDLDSMEIDQIYYIRTKYSQNGASRFSIFGEPNYFTVKLTRVADNVNQLCVFDTYFSLSFTYPPTYPNDYFVQNCGELFICKNDLFKIEAYNQTDYNYAEWKWKLEGAYITETNNISITPPINQDPPISYTPGPNNNNYLPDPYKIVAYYEQGGSYNVSLTLKGWKYKNNVTTYWYEGHKGIAEFTVTVLDKDDLVSNLPGDQCPNTDISSIMINIPPGFKVTKTYLERQPNIVVINNDTEFNSSFSLAEILTTTQTLPCGNYNLSVTFTPLAENIYFPQSCVPITPITKSFRIGFTPSISYTQNCFPNPIQFNGSSTCPDEITWWKWNFGDAQTSPLQNPTHQYNQHSNYNVYLSVGNNDPSCTFSTSTYYTFLTSPEKPVITGHNNNCSLECSYSVSNPNSNYIYTWTIVNSDPQNSNNYGSFSSSGVQTEIDGIGLSTVAIYWLSSFIAVPERVYLVVTVENAYGCIISDTMEIFDCCIGEDIVFQNETFPPIYINNKTVSLLHSNIISTLNQIYHGQIVINGILLVDQNLTINDNSHIKFGPCASIIINPACTLTINNSKLGQQCNYMWKGIYLNHGSSQIIITNNSEVCDALDGIVSRSGGNVYITSSVLKNNLYCLQIKNFGPPYVDDPVYFPGSVSMCSFTNDKAGGLLEYPPYAGFRSICGIEAKNVSNSGLIIGNAEDNSPNYFSNMNHAIRGTDSRLIICNH
ncbi:MAG TPA: PKD domain-containing protein [Bacteroidales bacterium]|nr:PKD domain-containing protein [Bacteroidales bacterium]HSA44620.1 PKD domain-containing protein [Bacteroidales bacterium]